MTRPQTTMVQKTYRNPDATSDLILPMLLICNTPEETIQRNVRHATTLDIPWLEFHVEQNHPAILCGGGPSLVDHLDEIKQQQASGAKVFAMNAASKFLRQHGIEPDAQVICDAKAESVTLYDPECRLHYLASQCDPAMFEQPGDKIMWHLAVPDVETWFPEQRRLRGGYSLIGGGATVGITAMCVAFVLGYRNLHLYGYDSSHRQGDSHAYRQAMNDDIPTVEVEWGSKTYLTSVAMKQQAERFQFIATSLEKEGVTVNVHGEGLLPAMWNTKGAELTMRDKYRLLWQTDLYRFGSSGECHVPLILQTLQPDDLMVDFGCGTGRASVEIAKLGYNVLLVDFADNCRDEEAMCLPFLEWDIRTTMPMTTKFGFCCDVMEHIPTDDVPATIDSIMKAASKVFFSISTIPDLGGALIHEELHVTVRPHEWWAEVLSQYGTLVWQQDTGGDSLFVLQRTIQ